MPGDGSGGGVLLDLLQAPSSSSNDNTNANVDYTAVAADDVAAVVVVGGIDLSAVLLRGPALIFTTVAVLAAALFLVGYHYLCSGCACEVDDDDDDDSGVGDDMGVRSSKGLQGPGEDSPTGKQVLNDALAGRPMGGGTTAGPASRGGGGGANSRLCRTANAASAAAGGGDTSNTSTAATVAAAAAVRRRFEEIHDRVQLACEELHHLKVPSPDAVPQVERVFRRHQATLTNAIAEVLCMPAVVGRRTALCKKFGQFVRDRWVFRDGDGGAGGGSGGGTSFAGADGREEDSGGGGLTRRPRQNDYFSPHALAQVEAMGRELGVVQTRTIAVTSTSRSRGTLTRQITTM